MELLLLTHSFCGLFVVPPMQVYTSHMQLGGPRVMGENGVSHLTVADDLEGARVAGRKAIFRRSLAIAVD